MDILTVKDRTDDLFRVLTFDSHSDYAYVCDDKAKMAMKMLDETIHINAKNGRIGDTILLKAIRLCEYAGEQDYMFKLIKKIVDAGADVNMYNDIGEFPLQIASYTGSFGIVALLVAHKANVNRMVDYGKNVLQYAIESYASNKLIELMIHKGADVNMLNAYGRDILYTTIYWHGGLEGLLNDANLRELVAILLANGANSSAKERLQNEIQDHGTRADFEYVWEEIVYNAQTRSYNRVKSLLDLSEGSKMPAYFDLPFVMQEVASFLTPCA